MTRRLAHLVVDLAVGAFGAYVVVIALPDLIVAVLT